MLTYSNQEEEYLDHHQKYLINGKLENNLNIYFANQQPLCNSK